MDVANELDVAKELMHNAERISKFGGKRFLGFTPNSKPVWISYVAYREQPKIVIKTTHDLTSLLDVGARLANNRVVLKMNSKNTSHIEHSLSMRKNDTGGKVSISTIMYLQKLISTLELGYGKGFVNGVPSRLLFRCIANSIFEGSYDWESGDTSVSYILKAWNFPSGEYFTIDSTPSSYSN